MATLNESQAHDGRGCMSSQEFSVHDYCRQYSACQLSNSSVYSILKLCMNILRNSAVSLGLQ